jgi:hypothetical protein
VPGLTGHDLGDHDALFHRLVREHRAGNHVADRPHAGQIGPAMRIDLDLAALGEFEPDLVGIQAIGVRDAADRDDQAIGVEFLLLARPCPYSRSKRLSARS